MTNNYKLDILKFLTGNLEEQEGQYDPQFKNIKATTNNLTTQIEAYFSSIVTYVDFIPSKNNKNQSLEYSVIACRGTLVGESDVSGAYVILDKDYNIVDVITHYSDGTLIGVLYCLNIDNNGNYYAVEYSNSRYRIVLLNNLVLKPAGSNTYQAIKVDTHLIPNQYTWDSMLKVFKNDGNNKYFVVANRANSAGIVGCELSIGDTDTWKYHTSTYTKSSSYAMFDNGYNVYWDSNSELQFQIAVNDYGLVILTKGAGVPMRTTKYLNTEDTNQNGNFIFYTNEVGYYAYAVDNDPVVDYYIYKINLTAREASRIYSNTGDWASYSAIWLFKNINSIYYYKIDLIDNNTKTYELQFGLIDDNIVYETTLGQFTAAIFLDAFCYANVITDFNKNYVFIQNQNTLFSLDFIWNSNNYNGEAYTSSNSLIPNVITIEDENEIETFNRNIYNLSSYSNWYTASGQIPNYYLNNSTLYNALLYSKNNNILASKNINTTKNIYEELNINFINRFKMIDDGIENVPVAAEFTEAMLNRQVSAAIGKIQINYNNNTKEIKTITTSDLTYSNLTTTLRIVVSIPREADTIDLISQDETIIYKTIDSSNFEINKIYLITQDIRIE